MNEVNERAAFFLNNISQTLPDNTVRNSANKTISAYADSHIADSSINGDYLGEDGFCFYGD